MYYKVKILKSLPTAKVGKQVNGSLVNDAAPYGGGINRGTPDPAVNKTLQPVARDKANLEAEKNETVFTYDDSGIPLFYVVGGERHFNGGTPLNLPDDSFIFSDTKSMKISDPQILKMFGKTDKKGSYTPAELSKIYDINVYRKLLQDPNSDKILVKTAEMMIKNYVIKLGALALAQESKKGFPQGIPKVAKPYMESQGISEKDLIPEGMNQGQEEVSEQPQEQQQAPSQMPNGEAVAMPEEMDQQQMSPEQMQPPMQRFGGARKLRRAQDGMQQPSPEEMAMMQEQQGQEQGGNQMQQIMQQVTQALQQGAKPEEVVAQLLQGEIAPEEVAQIFVELGMPEDQVEQLVMGVMQQMQGGQEQQVAQGQPSEEEMMMQQQQMQQAPMAAYGMQMGGYDMPFTEYAYGGYYKDGGYLHTAGNGEEVKGKKGNVSASKVDKIGTDYTSTKTLSGKTAGYKLTEGEKRANAKGVIGGGGGGTPSSGWEDAICDMIKKGATYEQLTDPNVAFKVTGIRKSHMAPGPKSKAIFDRCNVNAAKFEDTEQAVFIEGQPETECWCTVDGKEVPGKTNPDWDGKDPATKCLPCEEEQDRCYCPDPNDPSKEIPVDCNEDGTPPDCEAWERGEGQSQGGYEPIDNGYSDISNLNVLANLGMRKPNLKRELVLPKEKVPWATGIDPRQQVHAGNAQFADITKGLGALSTDSGSFLTNALMAQTPAMANANQAINAANQYNTGVSNDLSYRTTAALNKGIDERMPYIQNYIDQGNQIEGENVKFDNSKVANVVGSLQAREADKLMRNQINARSENFAFDRNWNMRQTGDKKIKPVQTHTYEDYIRYYRDKVGLSDDKAIAAAAKTAMDRQDQISKLGGQTFKHGGFIYSVFPNIL
jgi:hypothetical protein